MNPMYRIAVALSLTSNHASVLGALAWHLAHVHVNVNNLSGSLNRFQAALGGVIAVGVGGAMIKLMVDLTKTTQGYSDELAKLLTMGGQNVAMVRSGEMENLAFKISRDVPILPTDVMKIYGNAYSIFGKEDAVKMLKRLSQAAFVFKEQGVGGTEDAAQQMYDIMRAAERTGIVAGKYGGQADPAQMDRLLDLTMRVTHGTHGRVGPRDILGMASTGGFTMRDLTDEGFMTMAIMAQAIGGQKAGTAYMALWNQLSGGPMMFKRVANRMAQLGLLNPEDIMKGPYGHVGITDKAANRLLGLVQHDPMELATYLNKRFEAMGITDDTEKKRLIVTAFAKQTGQRFVGELTSSEQQMVAERMLIAQGMGVLPSLDAIMQGSVKANIDALTAAWGRFTEALAGPLTETTIKVLDTMRQTLLDLGDWARANPELVRQLAIQFTALGVALTVFGSVAIIGAMMSLASPGGLLFALAAGITALFAAFAGNSSSDVQRKITGAKDSSVTMNPNDAFAPPDMEFSARLALVFEGLKKRFENAILGIPDKIAWAIDAAFTTIGHMMIRALSGLPDRRAIVGPDRGFAGPGGPPAKPWGFEIPRAPGGASLGGPSLVMPASAISTGKGPTSIHIPVMLDIDGRTLADVMSQKLADLHEFPRTGYGNYNGQQGYTPGGFQGTNI
jgi:hypothetical protein